MVALQSRLRLCDEVRRIHIGNVTTKCIMNRGRGALVVALVAVVKSPVRF